MREAVEQRLREEVDTNTKLKKDLGLRESSLEGLRESYLYSCTDTIYAETGMNEAFTGDSTVIDGYCLLLTGVHWC